MQKPCLSNEDLFHINVKRKASSRLGFALQLSALINSKHGYHFNKSAIC